MENITEVPENCFDCPRKYICVATYPDQDDVLPSGSPRCLTILGMIDDYKPHEIKKDPPLGERALARARTVAWGGANGQKN